MRFALNGWICISIAYVLEKKMRNLYLSDAKSTYVCYFKLVICVIQNSLSLLTFGLLNPPLVENMAEIPSK
jgi:hypothetical protein